MTAVFLPLMTKPQPDTAERKLLQVQSLPFALPPKNSRWDRAKELAAADRPANHAEWAQRIDKHFTRLLFEEAFPCP